MSDKNLDLGLVEIMPNTIKVEYYSDLKKEIEKLDEGWEMSVYAISRYLMSMSKELKIREHIIGKYGYKFISQIEVIYDNDFGGKTLIIEDNEDIKKFMDEDEKEDAIGWDENGNEYEVSRGSSNVLNYEIEKGIYFVYRKK
jgi:hypothetical protein